MIAASMKVIDNQACGPAVTAYSLSPNPLTPTNSWINSQSGESFRIWAWANSVAGAVDVKLYMDISPLTETIVYNSTDTTKYIAVELTSGGNLTTENTLVEYRPTELDYPFCMYRIRAVGQGGTNADTKVTVYVTQASESWPC